MPAGIVDFAAEMLAATPLGVVSDFLPTFEAHDKVDAVEVLQRCETLMLGAQQDLMTPVEHTLAMARVLPGARLRVLDPGGHLAILEHPEAVNDELRDLFDGPGGWPVPAGCGDGRAAGTGGQLPTAEPTAEFGRRLAGVLARRRPGGAGGRTRRRQDHLDAGDRGGLGVRGDITSPTFVIARVHRAHRSRVPTSCTSTPTGSASLVEVDDLDLDASLADSVTVVEWGAGKVEGLAEDRLARRAVRAEGTADDAGGSVDETRWVTVTGIGPRWGGAAADALAAALRGEPTS